MRRTPLFFAGLFLSSVAFPSPLTVSVTVVSAATPLYPPLARVAKLQGDVLAEVTTSGAAFGDIKIVSGHALLSSAVTMNLRTWTLVSTLPTTFRITFHYKISEKCKGNPSIRMSLPTDVSICSPPYPPID